MIRSRLRRRRVIHVKPKRITNVVVKKKTDKSQALKYIWNAITFRWSISQLSNDTFHPTPKSLYDDIAQILEKYC